MKRIYFIFAVLAYSAACFAYTPSAALSYSNQSNIVIDGKSFTTGVSGAAVYLTNCNNVKITNCSFSLNSGIIGVRLVNCSNVEISGNYLENFNSGVYATGCTGGIDIHCNQFDTIAGTKPRGQMVQFNGCSGTGNRVNYNTLDTPVGVGGAEDLINFYNSWGTTSDPIQCNGNKLRGGGPSTSGGGIMLGDNGSHDLVCDGNILVDPGQYGISSPSGYNIVIKNNKVYSAQYAWTNVGIYVGLTSEIDAGFVCDGPTIQVLNNKVNWTRSTGIKNGWYNCPCCPGVVQSGNNFNDSSINSSILPATLTLNSTACGGPTATFTKTFTPQATKTNTPANTKTNTPQPTKTRTPQPTKTFTPAATKTNTPQATKTSTPAVTYTRTSTPVNTKTFTPANTKTATPTATYSRTATSSLTVSLTLTLTLTSTCTFTFTPVNTVTLTPAFTKTATPSLTMTQILTPVETQTFTASVTYSQTASKTVTPVNTFTYTPSKIPTGTSTATETPVISATYTGTVAVTNTSTATATVTITCTNKAEDTFTPTATCTSTLTCSATSTSISTSIATAIVTATATMTITADATEALGFEGETPVFCYPNPVHGNPDVSISLNIKGFAESGEVKLYTVSGRLIREIQAQGPFYAGRNIIKIEAREISGLANGTYIYEARLYSAAAEIKHKDMIIILR